MSGAVPVPVAGFQPVAGAGSRGHRAGRRPGRRRRTSSRRWRVGGRRWRRRVRRGCVRGRVCPTRRRRRSAIVSRSCGLMVRASPRTRARMVISRTPAARAMRAEPWPITCRARSRSRVPPASSRARGRVCAGDGAQGGGGVGSAGAAAGDQVVDRGGGESGGGGDAAVGAAVLAQAAGVVAGSAGTGVRRPGIGWGLAGGGGGVDAHVSSLPRLGGRAGRDGPGRSGGRSPGSG